MSSKLLFFQKIIPIFCIPHVITYRRAKPPKKLIASSVVPHWGSSAITGNPRACQDVRKHTVWPCGYTGHSARKVACLEFTEGEKRKAITADRAVEDFIFHGIIVLL